MTSGFMKLAFSLAKKTDPFPNPRVGAVIVKDGEVIGTGFHHASGKPHAEIEAIEDAKRRHGAGSVRGSILYVTLEPCSHILKRTPPCTKAIIRERIGKVVFAMKDPNPLVSGAKELKDAGIVVVGPTDEREAEKINKRYIENIRRKPFVAIKMAMSADGKTATRTGDSRWISSEKSRKLVHRMRSEYDAVMVGAGTVIRDDPMLTSHGTGRDPHRIIIDGKLKIPLGAKVLKNNDKKTIIATCGKAQENKIKKIKNALVFVCGKDSVDLKKLLLGLGAMGIKKILIEGGSGLNASALEAGIVDKLYLFIAPKIIGGKDAKPLIGGKGIEKMSQAIGLNGMKIKHVGSDFLLEADIIR